MIFSSKKEKEDDGRKVKISRTGNPASRPWLVRIYGMLGCLAITLGLIALMVFVQKTLPDGSKSQFHPNWRRDVEIDILRPRANFSVAPEPTFLFSPIEPTQTSTSSSTPRFTFDPILLPATFNFNLACQTTQVACVTIDVPAKKLRARYYETVCSTTTQPIACPSTPSPTPTTSSTPTTSIWSPTTEPLAQSSTSVSVDPCMTSIISCTENNFKRNDCFTSYFPISGCGATTSTFSTVSSTSNVDPCITTEVSCPVVISRGKRQVGTDCITSYVTAASCISSTSSLTPTPTSSSIISSSTSSVDNCITAAVSCPVVIPRGKRQVGTDCVTSYITAASCISSTSSLTPTPKSSSTISSSISSVDNCITAAVSCPVVISRGKRQVGTDCITSYITAASCISSTSSATPIPTSSNSTSIPSTTPPPPSSTTSPLSSTSSVNSCLTSTVSCDNYYNSDLERTETICGTSYSTISGCGSTTSSSGITTSSLPPCVTSTVSCEILYNADIGRTRTICGTSYLTISGCGSTTSTPSTTPSSLPPCVTSTVSCDAFYNADLGRTETICRTSYPTIAGCGSTTSSTTTSSSLPPCMTSTISCNTFPIIGKRQSETECSTWFFTTPGCGITSSSSTSRPTITPTSSLPSCMTSSVSCSSLEVIPKRQLRSACSTTFFSIPGCGITTSITTPTPSSSISVASNSCLSTGIVCTTFPPAVEIGKAIAEIGGFVAPTGTPDPIINCVTTFASIESCGLTITSNSSSSVHIPSTSLPNSTSSSIYILSSSVSVPSSSSSRPINPVTPLSSSPSISVPIFTMPLTTSISPSSSIPLSSISSHIGFSSSSAIIPVGVVVVSPSSGPLSAPRTSSLISTPLSPSSSVPARTISVSSSILTPGTPVLSVSNPSVSTPGILIPTVSNPGTPTGLIPDTSSSNPSVTPVSGTPLSLPTALSPPPKALVELSSSFMPSTPLPASVSSLPTSKSFVYPIPSVPSTASASLYTVTSGLSTLPASTLVSLSASSKPITLLKSSSSASYLISTTSHSAHPSVTLESEIVSSASITHTHASLPSSTSGGGGGGGGNTPDNSTDIPTNAGLDIYPISKVVVGNYVPIIVGRAFIGLVKPFYQAILMYEPIRQLTSPVGAPYSALAGSPAISIPIQAAMLIANLGSGFTAGATFLDTSYCSSAPSCSPRLSANPWVIDVIITTLVIQALTIVVMAGQWWKKPSSICADPTSIAGVAVVMGHPQVEADFSNFPPDITAAELARRLKGHKYQLGMFMTDRGFVKYGIMPREPDPKKKDKGEGFFSKLGAFKEKIPFIDNWRNNRLYFDTAFLMFLLALLGLTCAALSRVNETQIVFLATAAASGTGMRIFFAVLGVIVSTYWGRLFRDMQSFAPYINLGRGNAEPDPTILLRKHTFPITAFLPLLFKSHYTAASVAFTSLIAEFLIIALAGMPYRPGQQRGEFLFFASLSLLILVIMVVQLVVVGLWRRKLPVLNRAPDNIAHVMSYVARTGMARDFEELSTCTTRQRDREITELGKTYAYGWMREEGTGRVRWVVDEVRGKEDEHGSGRDSRGRSENDLMLPLVRRAGSS